MSVCFSMTPRWTTMVLDSPPARLTALWRSSMSEMEGRYWSQISEGQILSHYFVNECVMLLLFCLVKLIMMDAEMTMTYKIFELSLGLCVLVATRVPCGRWRGLTQCLATFWLHAPTTVKSSSGRRRMVPGTRCMNTPDTSHQVSRSLCVQLK